MNIFGWRDWSGQLWPLNGTDAVTLSAGAEAFKGMDSVSFTRDTALLDGQSFSGWRARPRDVLFPVMIGSDQYQTFAQTRKAFRSGMRPGKFGRFEVISDEGTRTLTCRYVREVSASSDIDPHVMGYEQTAFVLVADDPWWHGPIVSKTLQTAQDAVPFFEPGPTHVLNIMSANTVASPTLDNTGDVPVWYTVRVDGPATAFQFDDGTYGVAGTITIDSGEWLIVDTNPTEQTAILFDGTGGSADVTDQLTQYNPRPILPGETNNYNVQLNGAGSMTISVEPRYFEAF